MNATKPKWTPGKWTVKPIRRYGLDMYMVQQDRAENGTSIVMESRTQARAELVAAAPAMADSIRELLSALDRGKTINVDEQWAIMARAERILAEIEGRE